MDTGSDSELFVYLFFISLLLIIDFIFILYDYIKWSQKEKKKLELIKWKKKYYNFLEYKFKKLRIISNKEGNLKKKSKYLHINIEKITNKRELTSFEKLKLTKKINKINHENYLISMEYKSLHRDLKQEWNCLSKELLSLKR